MPRALFQPIHPHGARSQSSRFLVRLSFLSLVLVLMAVHVVRASLDVRVAQLLIPFFPFVENRCHIMPPRHASLQH